MKIKRSEESEFELEDETEIILAGEDEETINLASKRSRAFAFILDLVLIFTFVVMILSTFITPKKYTVPMRELQQIINEYGEMEDASAKKNLLGHTSPELQEMLQFWQGFTVFSLWIYFSFSEILMRGASIGKRVFSIKAISATTFKNPSTFDSLLRSGLKTLTLLAFFPILLVNYFIAFFTKRNQAGHDILCRTLVIEDIKKEEEKGS